MKIKEHGEKSLVQKRFYDENNKKFRKYKEMWPQIQKNKKIKQIKNLDDILVKINQSKQQVSENLKDAGQIGT